MEFPSAKILLIDDDKTTQLILRKALEVEGYEVTVASNGEQGVHLAALLHPALIICDWMMPLMDGLEVCRRVKANSVLATTFFILLTGREHVEDRVRGLDTGADEFLSKPIDVNELKARVRAGLRLFRLAEELMRANRALTQLNQQLLTRNELLESLSLTDQLTGLLNRRALDRTLPHLLQQMGCSEGNIRYRYLSVFMIDIDRFKQVNDTYGHGVGDSVLKAVAERLVCAAPPSSSLYRYGGEEIACITPGISPAMMLEYGEGFRAAIASDPIEVSDDLWLSITISIGGAIATQSNLVNSQEILNQADRALYQAKYEGRNCLRMYSPSSRSR